MLRKRQSSTVHYDRIFRCTADTDNLWIPSYELIKSAVTGGADAGLALGVGLFGGLAIGLSGLFQGKCAAAAADALGATGKRYCKLLYRNWYR